MLPSLQQDLQLVWQARPLQGGMPIRTQDELHKQQEPLQCLEPPGPGGSPTQLRVLPHNPPTLQWLIMQIPVLPSPNTTQQSQNSSHGAHAGQMASDQTDKHLNLLAEVTLCNDAYDKIVNDVPNTAGEQHTTMVTAMLDTGASMCIVSRCMTMQMEVSN